jgi:DNA-directed RNA polymerase I and III subunit RPAC2
VPHPSEDIMNVRVQTYNRDTCEAVNSNLQNIIDVCDVINSKFDSALNAYNKNSKKGK